jgi:hypothetical protein
MADEGGVAGALTDAGAQEVRALPAQVNALTVDWRSALPWAALVVGVAGGIAAAVWAWQRQESGSMLPRRALRSLKRQAQRRAGAYWG